MTVSNNSPSAGYIAWSGLHIQYMGSSYTIADGNTNRMYAYWTPSTPGSLQTSDTFPALAASDCLVFLNRGGAATVVPTATVVPGDLIVPGTVKADKIDVTDLFANAAFLQKLQVGAAYAGSAPPASPAVGQLWRNTGGTPNELVAWTGKGTSNARRYAAAKSGASVVIEDLSDSDSRALIVSVKTIAAQLLAYVQAVNLLSNGDLSGGVTTGWDASNGTLSVVSGALRHTLSVVVSTAMVRQNYTAIIGHKYYLACLIKPFRTHTPMAYIGGVYPSAAVSAPAGQFTRVSFLATATTATAQQAVYINGTVTTGMAIGNTSDFDNAILLDLTAIFGAGNEPTAAQMDAYLAAIYGNSWFNGTATLALPAGSFVPSPNIIMPISGKATVTPTVNTVGTVLTPTTTLFGVTAYEDEIGSDGHETHRSALKTLLGTETWLYYLANQPTDTTIARFQIEYSDLAYSPTGITSHFPFYAGPNAATTVEMACGHPSARSASIYIKKSRLSGWSDAWTDAQKISAFKVWLAAQSASGTPVQMLYQIATPTTTTVAETRIIGTNGAITITGNGVSVTAGYTGSGWAAVGAVQRLGVESVTITPEEGLRVDTVLVSADGAHQISTYFSARGARYGLFRSSDGAMILGGMVLPNGQPSGVAGAIVSPGSNGDSRIAIETASAGSGQARVDTAALHLVQPSFQGATDSNPAATGEKVPVWIEAVRSTYKNSNSEYMDNYNAAVKALTSMRLVAMSESGSELSWLMLQRTTEGSTIYTDGAYDGSDKARTLANFARCMRMSMPTGESIVFNATARRYMLDWKTIEDNYQKYQTFKGGNASARDVGIVIQSSGYYRFVFHVDLELASSSSGAVLHVNRMPSDWTPPTTRDYCTDLDLTPSSGPTRIAYRRSASAPLSATVTTCELVADLYCSYGDKILPVVATAAVTKTLVSEDTVFTAQRIG